MSDEMNNKSNKKNNDIYVCKRVRLYCWLYRRGFRSKYKRPDLKNPDYDVWIYDKTPELLESVDEYYKSF